MSIGADLALVGKNHINLDVASITMSADVNPLIEVTLKKRKSA
jgi:hypothetical protein